MKIKIAVVITLCLLISLSAGLNLLSDSGKDVYASQYVSMEGLLAYWDLDDGSGSTAKELIRKVDGRDLKVIGNVSWVEGKSGKAFYFDGSTVLAMDGAKVIRTENITVSLWAKIESFPESDTGANLFMVNSDLAALDRGAFDFGFFGAGLRSYVVNNFAGGTGDGVSHGVNIESQIKGKWQHFAVVYNQDEGAEYAKLYLNGNEVASSNLISILGLELKLGYPRTASYKKCDFNIGGYVDTGGNVIRSINGAMDDIAIYGRVLSAAEIKILASGTRPDFTPQPTATPQATPTSSQNSPTPGGATPTLEPSVSESSPQESSEISDTESSEILSSPEESLPEISTPVLSESSDPSSDESETPADDGENSGVSTAIIIVSVLAASGGIAFLIYYLIKRKKV